ncbi:MAG: hypothetical protein ACR2KL_02520 [Nocardioidaceae bacterium]
MIRHLIRGAAAGAAGTTALNAVSYLDMALRGRGTSSTPEDTVEKLAHSVGVEIPGDDDTRSNRLQGLGPLLGIVTGVGVGALAGAARGLGIAPSGPSGAVLTGGAAMVGANLPMAALGISDPRTWSAADWLADAVPHVAYGVVTYATLAALSGRTD